MSTKKTGALFLITLMALTGISISYAGWTDLITITGTVDTGTIDWDIISYSGTWVWKQLSTDLEITNSGPVDPTNDWNGDTIKNDDPDAGQNGWYISEDYELISSAWAQAGATDDTVIMVYENIFPCIDFIADFTIHYSGSIPARINRITECWGPQDQWVVPLKQSEPPGIYDVITCDGQTVTEGFQLHESDYVFFERHIHLPQEDDLQGKTATFTIHIELIQWNEYPYYNPDTSTFDLPNTILSSTMHFEGSLTDYGYGILTGTIPMTSDGFYANGGFDVYAQEGGTAYVQGLGTWTIGSDHDAYSSTGPWGTWYDPDCPDWNQYSLELTENHWYLRYTSTGESPMSGDMSWGTDYTGGYARESDLGTQNGGHDGSAAHGGGAQAWDWDCGWGVEVIPLELPGFLVTICLDASTGLYHVTMTPTDSTTTVSTSTIIFEGALTDDGAGVFSGEIACVHTDGYDVYGTEGAEAWFGDMVSGSEIWTSETMTHHDAWPTWTPDTPDWFQYSLIFYDDGGTQKWALYNHPGATAANPWYSNPTTYPAAGVPMSGTMDWITMYAEETDTGAYLPGTGTAEIAGGAAAHGGGQHAWDMDWSWGSEAVPLQYPGFDVTITPLGSGMYRVTLTPA